MGGLMDAWHSQVTVGRLDGNALTIPDSEVSGHHITLRWDAAARAWHVVDMGSLNGTMLNDRIISTSNRRPGRALRLSSDDIIQLGTRTKLKVTCTPHEMKQVWSLLNSVAAQVGCINTSAVCRCTGGALHVNACRPNISA